MSEVAPPRISTSFGRTMGRKPKGLDLNSIGEAWDLVKSDLPTWIPLATAALFLTGGILLIGDFIIESAIYGTVFNTDGSTQLQQIEESLLGLIPLLLVGIFASSLMYMGAKQARHEQVQFRSLFAGFQCLLPLLIAGIAVVGFIALGSVILIVPGLYLCGCLCFVPILVIDQKMRPLAAIKTSYNTMRPYAWSMFGLLAVASIVLVGGFFVIGVGVLFTLPIFLVTIGIAYNEFFPHGST